MKRKHLHSDIDREMNRALKHAKTPAEVMAIKAEATEKKRRAVKGEEVVIEMPTFQIAPDFNTLMQHAAEQLRRAMMPTITWTIDSSTKAPAVDVAKLDALKNVEPRKVLRRAPDLVQVITAWRAWNVVVTKEGRRLRALGKDHVWEPKKEVVAACCRAMNPFTHPAPQMNCNCGVWAFKKLDGLVSALEKYSDVRVLGKVSLWGRVIETENGYRAEKAYPSELWLLDSSLEELGIIYDVPVRITD